MTPAWMEGFETLCKCRHDFGKTGITWGLFLSPDTLVDAVVHLYKAGFFLEDISALDSANGFAAVYHLSAYSGPDRASLYVIVPHDDPQIPSISAIYSGALWHERETMDLFGIHFTGHPDPKPLLLPEDMTGHPLIKEAKSRASLKDLLDPGEIVERNPDFLFFEEADSSTEASKPEGQ
ncbi:MAG: NADH-quinone oxidoreductase subunit C [Deltaproteobacteria bacterium]|nr:NADH-quinone oxidoreductase subunit C [Deltaproteobacteria bacterium]